MAALLPREHVGEDCIAVLDAGASTLRAGVFDGDQELTRCVDPTGLPHPASPGAHAVIVERILTILGRLGHGPYDAVVLASTGIRRCGVVEKQLRSALADALRTDVLLGNDVAAAYLGALGPRPGLLLHAGTGSVTIAVGEDGTPVVLDGWGHLLGDRGSGYALGRAGLREAFREVDGVAESGHLAGLLLGGDPERIVEDLHSSGDPVRKIAALAPTVLSAADEADPVARRLVQTTADDLVATGVSALNRLGMERTAPVQVAGTGGLFQSPSLRTLVDHGLRRALPSARMAEDSGDTLRGALLLATTADHRITRALTSAFRDEDS